MTELSVSQVSFIIIILLIIAIVGFVIFKDKKKTPSPSSDQNKQAASSGSCSGGGGARMFSTGPQQRFASSGPMAPNTYTFSTAGPKYGASVGAIPAAIQAIQSPSQNWVGSFAPVSSSSVSSC